MFLTRTILAILGLWNPRPDPDEVREYQTQATSMSGRSLENIRHVWMTIHCDSV